MSKQLIGIFRVGMYLFLCFNYAKEIDRFNMKNELSDLFNGGHTEALRDSFIVNISLLVYYRIGAFYIVQTIMYVFAGGGLEKHRTGILHVSRMTVEAFVEIARNPMSMFQSSSTEFEHKNIDRVLEYRDSKMSMMSNEKAIECMTDTVYVDAMLNNNDSKQIRRATKYLNSKLSLMDNESALDYIRKGSNN